MRELLWDMKCSCFLFQAFHKVVHSWASKKFMTGWYVCSLDPESLIPNLLYRDGTQILQGFYLCDTESNGSFVAVAVLL